MVVVGRYTYDGVEQKQTLATQWMRLKPWWTSWFWNVCCLRCDSSNVLKMYLFMKSLNERWLKEWLSEWLSPSCGISECFYQMSVCVCVVVRCLGVWSFVSKRVHDASVCSVCMAIDLSRAKIVNACRVTIKTKRKWTHLLLGQSLEC